MKERQTRVMTYLYLDTGALQQLNDKRPKWPMSGVTLLQVQLVFDTGQKIFVQYQTPTELVIIDGPWVELHF